MEQRRTLSLELLTVHGLAPSFAQACIFAQKRSAGIAWGDAPVAFLLAAVAAFFTALTYVELSGSGDHQDQFPQLHKSR